MCGQPGKLIVGRIHEAGIHRSPREESHDTHASSLVELAEDAAGENRPVGQDVDAVYRIVRSIARIEVLVDGTVWIESGDGVAVLGCHRMERPADDNSPIRLQCEGINDVISTKARIE